MLENCCAFTGHRPRKFPWKYDEADSRCLALKAVLADQIAALVDAGFTQFLSGMAEATDTWSALSVLTLREKNPAIRLHCILPCKEQAEKWSASSQNLYYSILDRADSIVYVSRAYHKNCMLERNRFLVDHAAALLAVYNGERRGGTAATMRYAQKNYMAYDWEYYWNLSASEEALYAIYDQVQAHIRAESEAADTEKTMCFLKLERGENYYALAGAVLFIAVVMVASASATVGGL